MSTIGSTTSLGRSQSLRIPAGPLKPPPFSTAIATPNYISLFLTNLRLLNLDLRDDWPGITILTFSTRDAQQNHKKRIQCIEWALYHLFAIWDPEETKNKLQPFFPPLEQLQSLNLRAALFRCLDHAKKTGALGRDTVLRKTMLDECKGERLEEVLAVFSNVVLKKVVLGQHRQDGSIAMQLAYENFSYHGEMDGLNALILAHKLLLRKSLKARDEKNGRFKDFEQLLGLEDRRIIRRTEQLKDLSNAQQPKHSISNTQFDTIQRDVQSNWAGNENWLREIFHGGNQNDVGGLLDTRFDKVWKHVECGSIGQLEARSHRGLVDQLDAQVRAQQARLARWQAFGKQIERVGPMSPSKQKAGGTQKRLGYDLGLIGHHKMHVGATEQRTSSQPTAPKLEKHRLLVESLQYELAAVGKPRSKPKSAEVLKTHDSHVQGSHTHKYTYTEVTEEPAVNNDPTSEDDDGWSSASQTGLDADDVFGATLPSVSRQMSEAISNASPIPEADEATFQKSAVQPFLTQTAALQVVTPADSPPQRAVSPLPVEHSPESMLNSEPTISISHEAELADEILNSMAAASPSPKKRHTLSLAERTRLSMSRTTHSKFSDLHDEYEVPDLSRLSIRSRPSLATRTPSDESEGSQHADLIERTRKSMAGFEAAQKKAQLERRRSVKDEKRRQRQSTYFPKVEEEETTLHESKMDDMMDGDIDYDSVFMSRPKIATSPRMSPERIQEVAGYSG